MSKVLAILALICFQLTVYTINAENNEELNEFKINFNGKQITFTYSVFRHHFHRKHRLFSEFPNDLLKPNYRRKRSPQNTGTGTAGQGGQRPPTGTGTGTGTRQVGVGTGTRNNIATYYQNVYNNARLRALQVQQQTRNAYINYLQRYAQAVQQNAERVQANTQRIIQNLSAGAGNGVGNGGVGGGTGNGGVGAAGARGGAGAGTAGARGGAGNAGTE